MIALADDGFPRMPFGDDLARASQASALSLAQSLQ
jgi:hypothetical protein